MHKRGRLLIEKKPDPKDIAARARCTVSIDLGIAVLYRDATFDPSAKDAMKDERSSFTISEYPLGTCGKIDPENPSCAKITLTGKVSHKISFV
ncbi:hypothetical protein CFP56_021987 [Quercus suber]|uniref:CREG-like beta-barrel domain-containing protein n=1 Tax=Quercus suber TaxID=58331 RepID=A0AAW0KC30_QUESU